MFFAKSYIVFRSYNIFLELSLFSGWLILLLRNFRRSRSILTWRWSRFDKEWLESHDIMNHPQTRATTVYNLEEKIQTAIDSRKEMENPLALSCHYIWCMNSIYMINLKFTIFYCQNRKRTRNLQTKFLTFISFFVFQLGNLTLLLTEMQKIELSKYNSWIG